MKMVLNNKLCKRLYALSLFAIFSLASIQAQNYDYGSVEAYINDHKQQRSLLMARATLEYGNQLLHKESKESAADYKSVNADLDKYTRSFDVIDLIYQSVRTAVNVYHTYDDVKETLKGYKELMQMYNERVIKRGRIETADLTLLKIGDRAISDVTEECEYLYKSVYDLVIYSTGAAACSAADLVVMVENINSSLERLRSIIKGAYFATWRFVQLRIGFWKGKVYNSRTKEEILGDSFNRWRKIGKSILP